MNKYDYVRQSRQTRKHHCHWPGCTVEVAPAKWGCTTHWYKLPKDLRDRIWAAYSPGQEIKKTPSRAYVEAAQAVQEWIQENYFKNEELPAC